MASNVKAEFGRQFREARDNKRLSRAALGLRLGISPKTIQSWEMGRTFIEDLSLIPAIESELEISVSDLISEATGTTGSGENARTRHVLAGPTTPQLNVTIQAPDHLPTEKELLQELVAVPLIRPRAEHKPVADLLPEDIQHYVTIPGAWVPRGAVLTAFRMGDSGMLPMMPLGATVIIDRRPLEISRGLDQVVAMNLVSKGVRVRKLVRDRKSEKLSGQTVIEGRRSNMSFRPEQGDSLLGMVIGVLSQPNLT